MAEAIAEQNKKVEEESNALEKAIDEKSKQVDTKEQENKFERASKQVDAVGDAADSKFEEKANLVDKLGTDANNAIENQANKVEALGSQTDMAEDNASKMVDKIGKQIEKETDSTHPNSRTSISYTVQVPNEPHADQMIQKASDYDNYIRSNEEAEKSYPWPGDYKPLGDSNSQEEPKSDTSLKPLATYNPKIESDASVNEDFQGPPDPGMRGSLKKLFYMRHSPFRVAHRRRLRGHHRHHRLRGSKGDETGLLVLPRGGPQQLSEDVRDQLEDDQLLKKVSSAPFGNYEDTDMTAELKTSAAAEQDIERQWININTIGSPEYAIQWPQAARKTGNIGQQQFSVVSPGEVELLQTEYPEYPNPKGLGGDFRGITRSKIKEKTALSSKKSTH